MAKPALPAFGAGVLSGLRAAAGQAGGEPAFLLLDQIEEDPNQPRTAFDADELEQLAETIRLYGVLTPVGVRRLGPDRYRLVYGARRLRASHLAGQTRIPATILSDDKAGLAAQVVENQARAGLSNRDLAAAVNRLFADGMKLKQIAAVCNLRDYQVSAFRAADKLPPFLAERMDEADMRALYDLFRAWEKRPDAVEAAIPPAGTYLTITEARRVIEAATGKATSSVFLAHGRDEDLHSANPPPAEPAAASTPASSTGSAGNGSGHDAPAPQAEPPSHPERAAPAKASRPAAPPVFIMETADSRQGVLITDARPRRAGWAFLEVDGKRIEVPFAELRGVSAR